MTDDACGAHRTQAHRLRRFGSRRRRRVVVLGVVGGNSVSQSHSATSQFATALSCNWWEKIIFRKKRERENNKATGHVRAKSDVLT